MAATVCIPTQLRPLTAGAPKVSVAGSTVGEILAGLIAAHPGVGPRIFDDGGHLRRFVNVFVADEDVRYLQGLDTPVGDGDAISIVPAVAGGSGGGRKGGDGVIPVPLTVATYAAAFSEPDDGKRRELLDACFASDGVFTAPPSGVLHGRDALDAYIGGVQQQMPGAGLVRTTGIDEHHGRLRFRGKALTPDGDVLVEAVDHVAELDGDGRISRMTVFLGPLPPRE